MSAIVPPFDALPKIPTKAVTEIIKQIDKQTDKLLQDVTKTVQDSVKLPTGCSCDDPRIAQIKEQLSNIQKQITNIQENVPKIQQTIDSIKIVISTAVAIKTAINTAQLAIPATAGVFIAAQATLLQDATIVNAIESLNQFSTLPTTLTAKLSTILPPLLAAIAKVSNICNGDVDDLSLPESVVNNLENNNTDNLNDQIKTEFYTDINVSDSDLELRSDTIELLIERQQDLLTSLNEAPSVVLRGNGAPAAELGKPGDYYVDSVTNDIYGPKPSYTSWT